MAIKYKIDVLKALKDAGYNTNRLRTEKLFGQATIGRFRHGGEIQFSVLNQLCTLLDCQPGDILEFIPNEQENK